MSHFNPKKVAILGAGVMGAQIAAHFANAKVQVELFDLKSKKDGAYQILENALKVLQQLKPKPLATQKSLNYIHLANYSDDIAILNECDLIIEAIAERLDLKQNLYNQIAPHINERAIIASNTSGLSIGTLTRSLPENLHGKFCGVHFFNPPRYMPLVELIPHANTGGEVLTQLESYLTTTMGKSVILAKDTPNFVANRLGIFSMLSTCFHAQKFKIPFEVVDELTGKNLGRAKSATFRTADVVGLDTFAHVVNTMTEHCSEDGFSTYYKLPDFIEQLIAKGSLGAKTKSGIFMKDKDGIKVLDLDQGGYRLANNKADKEVIKILKNKNWKDKFTALQNSSSNEAKFLLACFADLFQYAASLLGIISNTPREMDLAMRNGFGWKEGIFEIWQQSGWLDVANYIQNEIKSGNTISTVELPKWVFETKGGVYGDDTYFDINTKQYVKRKPLPVYKRQIFPQLLLNEKLELSHEVLYENDGVKLWHTGDYVGILSFKSKMCSIGSKVLSGISEAIDVAVEKCSSMVIWQQQDIFSVGADLKEFGVAIMTEGVSGIDRIISYGHNIIAKKVRYSQIPIVAAVKGYTFGGGCELMLHCDGVVAALESYIGLVEAGVGLLPGWGGTTEMAIRAFNSINPKTEFEKNYKQIALAQAATSAYEAQEMGYLRDSDTIVMNSYEVLAVAKEKAKFMAFAGYSAPLEPKVKVLGEQGIANVSALLTNMKLGEQISEHDMLIATNTAYVMCGGNVDKGSIVDQSWLLNLEKEKFKELAINPKSMARIEHMLKTGKPLRN